MEFCVNFLKVYLLLREEGEVCVGGKSLYLQNHIKKNNLKTNNKKNYLLPFYLREIQSFHLLLHSPKYIQQAGLCQAKARNPKLNPS